MSLNHSSHHTGTGQRKLHCMQQDDTRINDARTSPVLIIDDDEELCELVTEYLRREGMNTDVVHDGESGTQRAQSGEYSVVVLDVMLPGIGGFEVLRRLRATRGAAARLPVLMLPIKEFRKWTIMSFNRLLQSISKPEALFFRRKENKISIRRRRLH